MSEKDLKIELSNVQDALVVSLSGEASFDFVAAAEHIERILSHRAKNVIVDAAELTFISSVGMCFLINLRKAVKEAGGEIQLAQLRPMVRKAMEHAHVIHLFDVKQDAV